MQLVGRSPENCARGPAERFAAALFGSYFHIYYCFQNNSEVAEISTHQICFLMLGQKVVAYLITCLMLFSSGRNTIVKETYTKPMALFWEVPAVPHAFVEILKARRAHLP